MHCETATCGAVKTCPVCRLCASSPKAAAVIRRQIAERQDAAQAGPSPPPCPHLGEPTGREVECASCGGLVSMPVYHCSRHTLTVIGDRRPKAADVTACRWCPDRPRSSNRLAT